jgi:hypothetical protein
MTTPPPTPDEGLREKIARVIDPGTWTASDDWLAASNGSGLAEKGVQNMRWPSLAKADEILALLPNQTAEIARLTEALALAEQRVRGLEAALKPFADKKWMFDQFKSLRKEIEAYSLTYADFRRAAQALSVGEEGK